MELSKLIMNYYFAQHLLLRMPVKTPAHYTADPQDFLDDPFFQAAIMVATPVFYQLLSKKNFQAEELNSKEAHSLQKYINRYCYRPTPFGLFSSVSLEDWTSTVNGEISTDQFSAYIRPDMTVQALLTERLLENELKEVSFFEPNPSIYRVLNEYRFIRTSIDDTGTQRNYQLQSIAFSKVLKDLLASAATGCSRTSLIILVQKFAACNAAEAADYADFLIDSQLLVNQARQSIAGDDQLIRLARQLPAGKLKHRLLSLTQAEPLSTGAISTLRIQQIEKQIADLPPELRLPNRLNIILRREALAEPGLSGYQDTLRDSISALEMLTGIGQSVNMTNFIRSFQQYFEGQTLPLLAALDPEAGIGYQQPETDQNNPLLETLHIAQQGNRSTSQAWTDAHSVLMQAWVNSKIPEGVITLTDQDLAPLKKLQETEQLLGMSVLFRAAGQKVFIENAGGINAPALLGRFTIADDKIAKAAKHMALQLEAANPEILFAEILHLADPHTDNVNRRSGVYRYEIPLTAASTLPIEQQLPLSDLYIRVVNNMVILFSEAHQKIVIPRLTSAYNHSLNKLPLFRFLADLSFQYGRSGLSLDLRQLFPNLQYYPRVEYKAAILSLATWVITEQQIELLTSPGKDGQVEFVKLNRAIRLPEFFSLAEGDQELVFNSSTPRDITFFCECIRGKRSAVLKEFIPQVRQYNAYLIPSQPLSLPVLFPSGRIKSQRKYVPGSEWLYLKIYGPKIGFNRLLLRLQPLLYKRYGGQKISQWFFIRYEDHAPHIRLRLKVNPEAITELLLGFKQQLEDRIQQHVIREFQIDVYSRELERYAAGGIENTERLFWASSELVLNFLDLQRSEPAMTTYSFALVTTYAIISEFIKTTDDQITFASDSYQLFLPEFSAKSVKVELDRKYRELSTDIQRSLTAPEPTLISGSVKAANNFKQSVQRIAQHSSKNAERLDYLRSIIHMHLNRLFTDEPRKQEMVTYYLLLKYLLSVKARKKQ